MRCIFDSELLLFENFIRIEFVCNFFEFNKFSLGLELEIGFMWVICNEG